MLSVRVSTFNESGLGEPEQDANSALTELDKGLRSSKVGEQCEAIVRFPRLFEKYPFPILINASMLKLADVFRIGNNFLRLCILRVCQQSEKHLDKISNVDEFVRRIYSVIHSNDPIARALTLCTLGSVAGIIPERQQVHHSIRKSLDSHDGVEVEAAINAAMQFASQSKTFAVSMCNKISDMIRGQSTPVNMKLQLIPILQYMHHDTSTAALVRQLCTDLLPTYPAQDFVLVTLKTMTQLAAATLVDIPSQVTLLLEYLRLDPRWEIKAQALKNLCRLADQGGHLWPAGAVEAIVGVASETETQEVLHLALGVIQVLTESPVTCHMYRDPESYLSRLCFRSSYSENPVIAAQAVQVLTRILCYCYKERLTVTTMAALQVITSLESLILQLVYSGRRDGGRHLAQLKVCLKCAVDLCRAHKPHCSVFVDLLGLQLDAEEENMGGQQFGVTMCEALGAIGGLQTHALIPLFPIVLGKLDSLVQRGGKTACSSPRHTQMKVMLCTLIFQALSVYEWNDAEVTRVMERVTHCCHGNEQDEDGWTEYRVARAASRYGHHGFAHRMFRSLTEKVSSEHLHFWLASLREITEAEACLQGAGIVQGSGGTGNSSSCKMALVGGLNAAVVRYNKAVAALRAASTPTHTLHFQAEYARARAQYLQCLAQLVHTCDGLCTVPPPAIASTIVQATRDDLQRYGYVTNQLRKSVKDFRACADLYARLYQSAFDADPGTLINIKILQQMCSLLEQTVEHVCMSGTSTVPDICLELDMEEGGSEYSLENRQMIRCCLSAISIARKCSEESRQSTGGSGGITHRQMECLLKQIHVLAGGSLCLPRYFFQVLQSTSVKLAISPQPRVAGEFISVQSGSQLAVKVEGVIQHGPRPGLFRTVTGVIITVTSQLQQTSLTSNTTVTAGKTADLMKQMAKDGSSLSASSSVLSQTVSPHRDFFTAQFLLAFPQGGQYALAVEASLVDQRDNTWRTGPKSTLTVKVPEEPEKKSTPAVVAAVATASQPPGSAAPTSVM